MNTLTQEKAKALFNYCPTTGVFSRKKSYKAGKAGPIVNLTHHGYLIVTVDRKRILLHRLIWLWVTGLWPLDQLDHVNHKRTDNRWINLRQATNTINQRNQSLSAANTSGFTGVVWHKHSRKWAAKIKVGGKAISLGYFKKKMDAVAARIAANVKYGFNENHGATKGLQVCLTIGEA